MDIGYATAVTVATAHSHGLPFVFIAPANKFVFRGLREQTSGIIVSATSPIRSARDLNGKTFGAAGLASLSEFGPRAWVDANGGDSSTIKFIEMPFSQLPEAVNAGRIDAAFIVEPFFAKVKETGRLLAVGLDAVAREFIVAGWTATATWAKSHPTEVFAFSSAIERATLWAQQNSTKAADILVQYLKVEPRFVASTQRAVFADKLAPALLQPSVDNAARYGKFSSFQAEELMYVPGR